MGPAVSRRQEEVFGIYVPIWKNDVITSKKHNSVPREDPDKPELGSLPPKPRKALKKSGVFDLPPRGSQQRVLGSVPTTITVLVLYLIFGVQAGACLF